jgi:putative membrane protein
MLANWWYLCHDDSLVSDNQKLFEEEYMKAGVCVAIVCSGLLLGCNLIASPGKQTGKQTSKAIPESLSAADRTFITTAADANLAEIETAKMIEEKSKDPGVRDFAKRMVTDHTQASQNLATVAEMTGVSLPAGPSAVDRSQEDELKKLSGTKLNNAYLQDELAGHRQVISAFESEIEHGQDETAKNYAVQTLPTLQDHIRIAEDLAGKMGTSGKAGLNQESDAITVR